jgi:hypothetical protein
MTWSHDDATIADLRKWLIEHGFVVVEEQYKPEAFGNQLVTLSRPTAVRLVRDRGDWSIELMGSDGQWRWIGADQPETGRSVEEQAVRARAVLTT